MVGDDYKTCNYSVTINKYACPMNCNGHGTCNTLDGNRTCECHAVRTCVWQSVSRSNALVYKCHVCGFFKWVGYLH